jgi:predicted TPR repeat methyltransferase
MKSPLEDTIWGASYGSVAAVREAFDRLGDEYHRAIMASGAPMGAARALMPHLAADARGIDFGCGSGALGFALRETGLRGVLDGVDLSPVMLDLAKATNCYRELWKANLLLAEEWPVADERYDFAITMGLVGDYVPYYLALPRIVAAVKPAGMIGYAVESRSTSSRALAKLAKELKLEPISETVLPVPQGVLIGQEYYFFVARR